MDKPRIKVPAKVKAGEPFEVKALISHKMESGQRTDEATGQKIPRMIINSFVCKLDGEVVFSVTLHPAGDREWFPVGVKHRYTRA